jgi:hypothetical protein
VANTNPNFAVWLEAMDKREDVVRRVLLEVDYGPKFLRDTVRRFDFPGEPFPYGGSVCFNTRAASFSERPALWIKSEVEVITSSS